MGVSARGCDKLIIHGGRVGFSPVFGQIDVVVGILRAGNEPVGGIGGFLAGLVVHIQAVIVAGNLRFV